MSDMVKESIQALCEEDEEDLARRREERNLDRLVAKYLREQIATARENAAKDPSEFTTPLWPKAWAEIARLLEYLLKKPR